MSRMPHGRKRGSALLIVMVLIVVLLGLASAMLSTSLASSRNAESALAESRALAIAEAGVNAALAELLAGRSGTLGTEVAPISYDSGVATAASTYYTEVYANADGTQSIVSRSNYEGFRKGLEVVVKRDQASVVYKARAAITARSSVSALGNFIGDGREWNDSGTALVGPGVFGVSTMATLGISGQAQVGGNGLAPTQTPGPTIVEQNALWPDGYPAGPDAALGLLPGTLKGAAVRAGTYCASAADWNALRTANGGQTPSGKVIYIEADQIVPFELGTTMNANPSLLVFHNSATLATAKNIHGYFKGLFLVDDIDHENAASLMVGAIMTFRAVSGGNIFGNGAANARYSSEALGQLPLVDTGRYLIVSWREFPAYIAARPPVAIAVGDGS